MSLVLGNLRIVKLRNLLNCNYFYIFLFIFLLVFLFFCKISTYESIYSLDDSNFSLIVDDYSFDEDKLSLTLKGNEDLVATYYIDDENELNYLKRKLCYGCLIEVIGTLKEPGSNSIPNTFDYKRYLNSKDIYYVLYIDKIDIVNNNYNFIYAIKNFISNRIETIDKTGYMKTFILGDKSLISDNSYEAYQAIGVTHLFALSGMHIGFLSALLLIFLKNVGSFKKYFLINVFLIIYGFVVGYPSSIKRCILFFVLNSFNKIFDLKVSSLRVLFLVSFLLILSNYKIIYDVGFIYSICTVGGIIFCGDYISCDNKIVSAFRLSLVAFLFSLPISLYNFYQVNFLSIFYNMFYVLYVSFIVYPLSIFTFLFPFLSVLFSFFIYFLEQMSNLLFSIDFFIIFLNFNIFEVLLFYLFLLILFYKNDYRYYLILFLLIIIDFLIPYFDSSSYVYFFDVGQGDSSLIVSSYRNSVVLIDTGGVFSFDDINDDKYYVSSNIITFMKSIGINRIDFLLLTHGDYDHMGDAGYLVENFRVKNVVFNCGTYSDLEKDLIKELDKNNISYYSCIKELNIDKNKLYFLQTKEYDNENDNSNVIYTELNGYKFMFMGDASTTTEREILDKYNLPDIDVLKVGHHGSRTSSSKEFINEINTKYSIISVGKNNRYGHPNKEVLDNLENSKIYRTDQDGSIEIKLNKNGFKIRTCPP